MSFCGSLFFIILVVHWASWICRLLFFKKFGKFSPLYFEYFFCSSLSPLLLLLLLCACWCTWWCLTFLWGSVYCFSFFFHCSLAYTTSVAPSSSLLFFFLPVKIYCCTPLVIFFKFQLLYFSTPEFPLGYFFIICTSLLIFSIWCDSVIISPFTSLIMISFSSVNRFGMAILKSSSGKSDMCSLTGCLCCCFFLQQRSNSGHWSPSSGACYRYLLVYILVAGSL